MPSIPPGRYRAGRTGLHARPATRRWPLITALSVAVVVGAFGVVGGMFAYQALSVKNDLLTAKAQLKTVVSAARDGNAAGISQAGDKVLRLTTDASDTVDGPLWDMAAGLPGVGPNVDAVRRAAKATDVLAEKAMPIAVDMLGALKLDKMGVKDGGMNLSALNGVEKSMPEIRGAFAQAKAEIAPVDRKAILPVVDNAVSSLFDIIDQSGPVLDTVEHYLPTLLKVAGAEGKRNYLLIFQNNAEARATGGLPAATALVTVDDGNIDLGGQTSTYSFPRTTQFLTIPPETASLYEDDTFKGFGNFTRTPDFPTTAHLFDALWTNTVGYPLDGVISIDPVVLSEVLKVTGPVKLQDGRMLTSKNAVENVLYDAYHRYKGNKAQDSFFSDAAARVFDKVAKGGWDPMKMLTQLQDAIKEQRLYAWFAQPDEEAMAVEFGLDGEMSRDNATRTEIGLYLNDAAYSKLEYFLSTKADVTCSAPDREVTMSLQITNSVPEGAMTNYQQGIRNKRYGISRDAFILDVLSMAPPGAQIVALDPQYGDAWDGSRSGVEFGHQGEARRVFVMPGTTRTVSFTVKLPDGPLGPLDVRTTPTVTTTPITVDPSCGEIFPKTGSSATTTLQAGGTSAPATGATPAPAVVGKH